MILFCRIWKYETHRYCWDWLFLFSFGYSQVTWTWAVLFHHQSVARHTEKKEWFNIRQCEAIKIHPSPLNRHPQRLWRLCCVAENEKKTQRETRFLNKKKKINLCSIAISVLFHVVFFLFFIHEISINGLECVANERIQILNLFPTRVSHTTQDDTTLPRSSKPSKPKRDMSIGASISTVESHWIG